MTGYNYIKVTQYPTGDFDSPMHYEYKWIGDGDECEISDQLFWEIIREMREPIPGEIIHFGQFELTCIGESGLFFYTFTKNKRFAQLKLARLRIIQWLQLINFRILRTLIVWNLAKTDLGTVPGWQDVHLVRRARETYWQSINFMRRIRERRSRE